MRGPGDILGTRQSGLASFVLGDIMHDTKIIEAARKDAKDLLENHEDFESQRLYFNTLAIANKTVID